MMIKKLTDDDLCLRTSNSDDVNDGETPLNAPCYACLEEPLPNAVFLGCGQGGMCYECALSHFLISQRCPLCRQKIDQIVTVNPQQLYTIKDEGGPGSAMVLRVEGPGSLLIAS
mmetsp:Transcript_29147/g.66028  ORF Transcript_29147/g.66028 Transcript_29147/m.66028 type:complete len:114 (-) Transcript_29147:27-368(-)